MPTTPSVSTSFFASAAFCAGSVCSVSAMYWIGWPLTPPLAFTQSKYAFAALSPSVKSVPGCFVAIASILIGLPVGFWPLPLPHLGLSTTDPLLLLLLPLPPQAATTNDRPAATTTSAVTDRPLFEPKYLFTDLSSSNCRPSVGSGGLGVILYQESHFVWFVFTTPNLSSIRAIGRRFP